jgi:hypothetical protein
MPSPNLGNDFASEHDGLSRADESYHKPTAADESREGSVHGRSSRSLGGEAGFVMHEDRDLASDSPAQCPLHQPTLSSEQEASRTSTPFGGLCDMLLEESIQPAVIDTSSWTTTRLDLLLPLPADAELLDAIRGQEGARPSLIPSRYSFLSYAIH